MQEVPVFAEHTGRAGDIAYKLIGLDDEDIDRDFDRNDYVWMSLDDARMLVKYTRAGGTGAATWARKAARNVVDYFED